MLIENLSLNKQKLLLKLSKKKHRQEFGLFIIEGSKIVEESFNEAQVEFIVVLDKFKGLSLKDINIPIFKLSEKEFKKYSSLQNPEGILAVVKIPESKLLEDPKRILMLNDINDPGNLGTIIRTLDWFNFDALILQGDCVDPYNEKVVRSSMGSIFRLPIIKSQNALETFENYQNKNFELLGLSLNGTSNLQIENLKEKKLLLVFGSESHGIPSNQESQIENLYQIPKLGKAESLNLSVSVGIACNLFAKN
ncbi:RNA methyltransferase [bacterium]|jgi:RNA methyltransferase, TrmH family|nr:RNA methyltransferase [bacterium]MBT6293702.1 RNA methyltransferase [bacterium]